LGEERTAPEFGFSDHGDDDDLDSRFLRSSVFQDFGPGPISVISVNQWYGFRVSRLRAMSAITAIC
jgi:hypothetical protein